MKTLYMLVAFKELQKEYRLKRRMLNKRRKILKIVQDNLLSTIAEVSDKWCISSIYYGDQKYQYDDGETLGYYYTIGLNYTGLCRSEKDAREDLAEVMAAFGVILGHLSAHNVNRFGRGQGMYGQLIEVAGETFLLQLIVPWYPSGCAIVDVRHEAFTTKEIVCMLESK